MAHTGSQSRPQLGNRQADKNTLVRPRGEGDDVELRWSGRKQKAKAFIPCGFLLNRSSDRASCLFRQEVFPSWAGYTCLSASDLFGHGVYCFDPGYVAGKSILASTPNT